MGFSHTDGTVLESLSTTEQRVYSSGGGGTIVNGTGAIYAPAIHTQNIAKQDFWLKTNEGEKSFGLRGRQVPMRSGHRVTIIWCADRMIAVVNHSTGEGHFVAFPLEFCPARPSKAWYLIGGTLCVILSCAVLPLFVLFYLIWRFFNKRKKHIEALRHFTSLFETELRRVLDQGPIDDGGGASAISPIPLSPRGPIVDFSN